MRNKLEPLETSFAMQDAASAQGFDWPNIDGVVEKIKEEVGEIEEAISAGDLNHARLELGDLLFACINLARFLNADPSQVLERANEKFQARFLLMKEVLDQKGHAIEDVSFEELNAVWEQVKRSRHESE